MANHTIAEIVNDYQGFRVENMPYGGVKDSGVGREGSRYAIKKMTELKLMVLNLRSQTNMRMLIPTVFLFFMFVSSIYAVSFYREGEFGHYEKSSTLEIVLFILIALIFFLTIIGAVFSFFIIVFRDKKNE